MKLFLLWALLPNSIFAVQTALVSPTKICALMLQQQSSVYAPSILHQRLCDFKQRVEAESGCNVGSAQSLDTVSFAVDGYPNQKSFWYPNATVGNSPAGQVLARLNRALVSTQSEASQTEPSPGFRHLYWDNQDLLRWSQLLSHDEKRRGTLIHGMLDPKNQETRDLSKEWVYLPDSVSNLIFWIASISTGGFSFALSSSIWPYLEKSPVVAFFLYPAALGVVPIATGWASHYLSSIRKSPFIPTPFDLADRLLTIRNGHDWYVAFRDEEHTYEVLFTSTKGDQRIDLLVEPLPSSLSIQGLKKR